MSMGAAMATTDGLERTSAAAAMARKEREKKKKRERALGRSVAGGRAMVLPPRRKP